MAKLLRYAGIGALVAAAWLALAGSVGWMDESEVAPWVPIAFKLGLGLLVVSVVPMILNPVGRWVRQGRCVRCGRPIERGQVYCMDHLKATINEYRDQTRPDLMRRGGKG